MNFGQEVAERSTKVHSRAGHDRKTGGPRRLKLLFRAIVAVMAIVPSMLALQAVAGQGASAATVPTVTSLSSNSGQDTGGDSVLIFGTGFTGAQQVTFGSLPATFIFFNDTELEATAPAAPVGVVNVTVTTSNGTSAISPADQYTYVSPLAVSGVSPNAGPAAGGTTVAVIGSGFTGATEVLFGSTPAPSFTVDSDGQITATTPAGTAGTVDVRVQTPSGESAASTDDQYKYVANPCTTTITGTNATQLTVTSGETCLVNATQNGQVTVEPGAKLSVANSTINGTVTATSPSGISICGTTESGTLTVTGATSPVILGGVSEGCAPDTIPSSVTVTGATAPVTALKLKQNGTLTLENDTDQVTLAGSQLNGRVYVENDAATAPGEIEVSGNTVTGSLHCTGNNPAPSDNGIINTVNGTATDQCAGIAQH